MTVAVIINPISGSNRRPDSARARVELTRDVLQAHGVAGDIFVTERPGHASEIAAMVAGHDHDLVFAWGGDGTVNEVASVLAFRERPLAIVPAGSGNGLARELGVSFTPEVAIASALAGTDRSIDAGEIGGRLFFNVAGVGFDARIARLFNARGAGRRGLSPYVWLTLRELLTYVPAHYLVTVGDRRLYQSALFVALANSRQYGNGAQIAPDARVDDGALDLVVVEARPVLASVWLARRLFTGTLSRGKGVVTQQVEQVTISTERSIELHVDGEPMDGGPTLTGRVHPRALRVRVPRTSRTLEP